MMKVESGMAPQPRKPIEARKIIAAFLIMGAVAIGVITDFGLNGPKARLVGDELETEAEAIEPPSQAVLVRASSSSKPRHALIGREYTTDLDFSGIRAHYDRELTQRGWVFTEEWPIRDWWRDLGGRSVLYRKGDYFASLQYAGKDADYGWTYALTLSWGIHNGH